MISVCRNYFCHVSCSIFRSAPLKTARSRRRTSGRHAGVRGCRLVRQLRARDHVSVTVQPSGTVTLVFTDIEGSTVLLDELGAEAFKEALGDHRRVLRAAFGTHSGYEVNDAGDGLFYAFASGSEAVTAVAQATHPEQARALRLMATFLVESAGVTWRRRSPLAPRPADVGLQPCWNNSQGRLGQSSWRSRCRRDR
jgi:class 3 adenylate cyclase